MPGEDHQVTAPLRKVIGYGCRTNPNGDERWVLALECGHTVERTKRTRTGHRDKHRPNKARCTVCTPRGSLEERIDRFLDANLPAIESPPCTGPAKLNLALEAVERTVDSIDFTVAGYDHLQAMLSRCRAIARKALGKGDKT
jgi:hypothetical protein